MRNRLYGIGEIILGIAIIGYLLLAVFSKPADSGFIFGRCVGGLIGVLLLGTGIHTLLPDRAKQFLNKWFSKLFGIGAILIGAGLILFAFVTLNFYPGDSTYAFWEFVGGLVGVVLLGAGIISFLPSKVQQFLRNWGSGMFGLDLRSLALFRIGIALMLLTDLGFRAYDLVAFYTDEGVLPQTLAIDRPSHLLIHQFHGSLADPLVPFEYAASEVRQDEARRAQAIGNRARAERTAQTMDEILRTPIYASTEIASPSVYYDQRLRQTIDASNRQQISELQSFVDQANAKLSASNAVLDQIKQKRTALTEFTGSVQYQATLFIIAAFFAVLLALGCWTRTVTIISWLLLVSVQGRQPFTGDSGQDLLRLLLFWAIFLPWGARFSIDAARKITYSLLPKRVVSVATIAVMLQMCMLYWFAYKWKTSSEWRDDGSAVYYVLSLEMLTTSFGQWLRGFPKLLRGLTFASVGIEAIMPWLFFFPWRNYFFRYLAIIAFIGMHVGFALTLCIEIFPYTCMVAWLVFLPSHFWDWLGSRLKRPLREGLAIYYDPASPFCRRMVLLARTFLILPNLRIRRLAVNRSLAAEAAANNSWALMDAQQNRYFGFAALVELMRRSPIAWPLGWLLSRGWFSAAGQGLTGFTAQHRKFMGVLTCWMCLRRPRLHSWPRFIVTGLAQSFVAICLVYVIGYNLIDLKSHMVISLEARENKIFTIEKGMLIVDCIEDPGSKLEQPFKFNFAYWIHNGDNWDLTSELASEISDIAPGWLVDETKLTAWAKKHPFNYRCNFYTLGRELRLDQHWGMFAEAPLKLDGWFSMEATIGNHQPPRKIDLWSGAEPTNAKPEHVAGVFPTYRWFKHMEKFLPQKTNGKFQPSSTFTMDQTCHYLCEQWNLDHQPNEWISSLDVYFTGHINQPPHQEEGYEKALIYHYIYPIQLH